MEMEMDLHKFVCFINMVQHRQEAEKQTTNAFILDGNLTVGVFGVFQMFIVNVLIAQS